MIRLLPALFFLVATCSASAQGVSIHPSGSSPDPSAMLDVTSTQSGFLLPRMTSAQRDAIASPAIALQIFNTTTNCLEIFIPPAGWQQMYCGCTPAAAPAPGTHAATATQITWNWSAVPGALYYVYNTTNTFSGGTQTTQTSHIQSGLTCGGSYSLYVWAVNDCGASSSTLLQQSTAACLTCATTPLVDIDGNAYPTVQIGTQCWMKENLRVTRTAAGVNINRYCHNCPAYGGHYDWNTIMQGAPSSNSNPSGVQGICPSGWHLPSRAEYEQMVNYLQSNGYHCGNNTTWVAKALANASGWAPNPWSDPDNCTPANNQPANNTSGFSLVGGGYWNPTMQQYYQSAETIVANIHEGYQWTATQAGGSDATFFRIGQYYYEPGFTDYTKNGRGNVRCVRD